MKLFQQAFIKHTSSARQASYVFLMNVRFRFRSDIGALKFLRLASEPSFSTLIMLSV